MKSLYPGLRLEAGGSRVEGWHPQEKRAIVAACPGIHSLGCVRDGMAPWHAGNPQSVANQALGVTICEVKLVPTGNRLWTALSPYAGATPLLTLPPSVPADSGSPRAGASDPHQACPPTLRPQSCRES